MPFKKLNMNAVKSFTVKRTLNSTVLLALFVSVSACASPQTQAVADKQHPPRLVLQVTVDQLRGDLPVLVMDRLEPGGFRYLAEQGTWYADAHHPHANTETIVGHVTLATRTGFI